MKQAFYGVGARRDQQTFLSNAPALVPLLRPIDDV